MSTHKLRIRPDKIGSVCLPFDVGPYLSVSQQAVAEEGVAVLCKVRTARQEYGHLELCSGRAAILVPGDVILGVLGARAALRGFCGKVPERLAAGDTVYLLNQGGVIGTCDGRTVGLGMPIELEVMGTPMPDDRPLRLSDHSLPSVDVLPSSMPPVLGVFGTCMHSGKTTAAAVIIHDLRSKGLTVHAGKATGVACIRDLLLYADNGASVTASFLDCGIPSTCYHDEVPAITRNLLAHLGSEEPDAIVVEMGDGLLGSYGVDEIISDPELSGCFSGAVLAANDIIGGWAAATRIAERGIPVRVITGPATDNLGGEQKLRSLGFEAANIFREPERVCALAMP